MKAVGDVLKYGDNVDTDVIIPARYLNSSDPAELAKHCMEDLDIDFLKKLKTGDIVVGGQNFGCGSSREHAPVAIKAAGVSCVIAKSFARIFYRNAINIGFPILECQEAAEEVQTGHKLEVDFKSGIIKNLTLGKEYKAQPFPEFIINIMDNSGLIECVKENKINWGQN
jgi:3-isopropylmalate/(R)-2-methylmalate dehydratase small subunit